MLAAQGRGLDPAELLKPLGDQWPTYSGDYSGKRYSSLKQINQTTVKNLTLAWTVRLTDGPGRRRPAAAAAAARDRRRRRHGRLSGRARRHHQRHRR